MVKLLQSFRMKMVALLGLSMFLSSVISYFFYISLQFIYRSFMPFSGSLTLLRDILDEIGIITPFLFFFIILSILIFFLLTKSYSTYFQEISTGIRYLAQGDFQHRVRIQTNDEFKAIAQDINLASEKLKEAIEKGEFSESSKDQLVINLAHDLRTPLTSVLGYLDLILKDEQMTEEQTKHFLTIALTKSQRLEKLIDELFEITRMNYGMLKLNKQSINLSGLLNQLNEEMYPALEKNQLTARITITSQLHILGDGELLARVFENLLMNACRYGRDGQFVDINGYVESEKVVIQIVNYGDRIPPEELPHIFDMFYSGDKARTEQEGSTGLGLFIAKNIVEQHDGSITVESSVIHTIFEVRLPLEKEHDELTKA
ncbi:sensor histidine kinase [Chengkuizengella axinellae]|uniref:histidine kinase n=1 Tax=Chengkuizengella axinellae TaxID=3064388 RepID=A0ABT9IYU3_9BACL|nr:HAMP domain-containing sensor histidine kinase [Chengkuizengella sp. 2205SS18-9]MDP5274522.1 HAMP domain-containing sensor histidine kinase [Chengkuizengella sp. 2205SS18-9]